MAERSGRCSFPIPGFPYLLLSLFSDNDSPFFGLLNTKEDQLDKLVSISDLWEWFSVRQIWGVLLHKCSEGRHCIFFHHSHPQTRPQQQTFLALVHFFQTLQPSLEESSIFPFSVSLFTNDSSVPYNPAVAPTIPFGLAQLDWSGFKYWLSHSYNTWPWPNYITLLSSVFFSIKKKGWYTYYSVLVKLSDNDVNHEHKGVATLSWL